jgi:OHCU decarboxylase
MNLTDVTRDRAQFCSALGEIYEHSPWVAERAWDAMPFGNLDDLAAAMERAMRAASHDEQVALIRAHPDLAGRLALAGGLTVDSTTEQAAAGLDQCTPEELTEFQALNDRYKERFAFPFIMAVRNSTRVEILDAFRRRVENDPAAEFAEALDQIANIARLRLSALFAAEDQMEEN